MLEENISLSTIHFAHEQRSHNCFRIVFLEYAAVWLGLFTPTKPLALAITMSSYDSYPTPLSASCLCLSFWPSLSHRHTYKHRDKGRSSQLHVHIVVLRSFVSACTKTVHVCMCVCLFLNKKSIDVVNFSQALPPVSFLSDSSIWLFYLVLLLLLLSGSPIWFL